MIYLYLNEIAGVLSDKTVEQYTDRLKRFDYWMTAEGRTKYDRKTVVDFIRHMQFKEVGAASIALHKTAISAFYSWLVENEKIPTNPVPAIKVGKYRSPKRKDDCVFTEAEYLKIREACKGRKLRFDFWEGAVIVGWNTGLRLGDIACLEWSEVDLKEGLLNLVPNKTRRFDKHVCIPITPELNRFFRSIEADRISDDVFPAMHSQYQESGAKHLSQQFTRICERAGVFDKSFHFFRHSLVSRLLSKNVPVNVISGITGQTLPVISRYAHSNVDEGRKAMMNLV